MLSVTHATAGAYIATLFPNPLIYIPAGVALHYLGDSVPHWDAGVLPHHRSRTALIIAGSIDLLLAGLLVFFLFQKTIPHSWAGINYHAWFGAGAGILPDVIEIPHSIFGLQPKFLQPFFKIHNRVHRKTTNFIWGIIPQILIIGSIIWLTNRFGY